MPSPDLFAPGWPGIPPRWTSSAKSGVGTSLSGDSHLWFTISHGVINEIYYPRIDRACTRDMGLIITDGRGFVSEEKRDATHEVNCIAPGVPAYRLRNSCPQGRYQIHKQIISDPFRPAVLQRVRFTALEGARGDYRLHVLLAPHLGNQGNGNTAWVAEHKGIPMLFAERAGTAIALACSAPLSRRSVGFVGKSDGWQDLVEHNAMTWQYTRAEKGNVAMMAEIELPADDSDFMIVLAFGVDPAEAGHRARAALHDGFDIAMAEYTRQWDAWQDGLLRLDDKRPNDLLDRYRICTMVMRARTRRRRFPAASSHRCRFRGASTRATRTSAAITWCGRATWSRRPAACSLPAGLPRWCASCHTCKPPRKPTATGDKTCGSMARHTGSVSRWTRPRCQSCWSISPIVRAHSSCPISGATGRWYVARPHISPATDR